MGRYKFSRFLDEVHERLKKLGLAREYIIDRLWVEWRNTGWKKLVRIGNYLPYLQIYDGVAIEVLEPYCRFRLVNGARDVEVELDENELQKVIANQYSVKKTKVKAWDRKGKNVVGFRERNWWFSDWHFRKVAFFCYMFDLDVVLAKRDRIVRAYDIKWGFDSGTDFERDAYRHLSWELGIDVEEIYVSSPQEAVEVITYEVSLV